MISQENFFKASISLLVSLKKPKKEHIFVKQQSLYFLAFYPCCLPQWIGFLLGAIHQQPQLEALWRAAAVVLLPLFSHFRVPYKSSGPGLMLSNEKRQGHTMLVDDVSSLRPLLYCSRCLRSSSHPKTWAAKVLLSFLAIYGIQGCIRPCPTSQLR